RKQDLEKLRGIGSFELFGDLHFSFELAILLELDHIARVYLCGPFHEQHFCSHWKPILDSGDLRQIIVGGTFRARNGKILGNGKSFVFETDNLIGTGINPAAPAVGGNDGALVVIVDRSARGLFWNLITDAYRIPAIRLVQALQPERGIGAGVKQRSKGRAKLSGGSSA